MATITAVVSNKKKAFLSSLLHGHGGHRRAKVQAQPRVLEEESAMGGPHEEPTIRVVPYEHPTAPAAPATAANMTSGAFDNKADAAEATGANFKKLDIMDNYSSPLPLREATGSEGSLHSERQPFAKNEYSAKEDSRADLAPATAIQRTCGSGDAGPSRPRRSKTIALGPLERHPLMLPPSSTMPLGVFSGALSADDIGKQTEKMLKATEELKPLAQAKSFPTSSTGISSPKLALAVRKNSLIRRIFSNNLLERFHFGHHARTAKNPSALRDEMSRPLCVVREKPSSIASLELRFNERENLNKNKVQQMIGTYIMRKPGRPVDKVARAASPGPLSDDPFSELPDGRHVPTEFEIRLRTSPRSYEFFPRYLAVNPFDSEGVLESDVDSPLPESPVAASTPRRRGRLSDAMGGSPVKRSPIPRGPKQPDTDTDDELPEALGSQTELPMLNHTQVVLCRDASVKKHPSPARFDLEALEQEFRKHFPCIQPNHHDNEDDDGNDGGPATIEAISQAHKAVYRSVVLIPDGYGSALFYAPPSTLIRSQTEVRIGPMLHVPDFSRMVDGLNLEVPFHSGSDEVY